MKLSGIFHVHSATLLENETIALNAGFKFGRDEEKKENLYDSIAIYCNKKANKSTRSFAQQCVRKRSETDSSLLVYIEAIDSGATINNGKNDDKYVNRKANLIGGHFVDVYSAE